MSALPSGWCWVSIRHIGEIRLGRQRSPDRATGPHMRPYMRAANVTWKGISLDDVKEMDFSPQEFEAFALQPGDVLVGEASGSRLEVGKSAVWRGEVPGACFQNTLIRVRVGKAVIPEYLQRHLAHDALRGALAVISKGIGIHHIGATGLAEWQISLAPLSEQKRIVEKIDALIARVNACRDRIERVGVILKRFRQSVLAAATSGELTREWRGGQDAKWEEKSIEQLCLDERYALAIGPFGSNLKVADYRSEGVPLVFVRDIRARNFRNVGTKYVSHEKAKELRAHAVRAGDLLLTKMGDPPGDTAIYPGDHHAAIITADVVRLRVDPHIANTSFVGYAIESPLGRERIDAITAGVAQQKISLKRFRRMLLPVPPLPEQVEIAKRVGALFELAERLERRVSDASDSIDRSTACVLAKAFRGELVQQDPNDEAASKLLTGFRPHSRSAGEPLATKRRRGRNHRSESH